MSDIGLDYEPSAEEQDLAAHYDEEREREYEASIQACLALGLDLRGVRFTDLGDAAALVAKGEPWCETEIAGLQFYDYGVWDPMLEERVMPRDGDRLSLQRALDNVHDSNAVEVWFRNGLKLGHLPRAVAAAVAGPLDLGMHCLAYIADGGTGEAWTAKALLVGEAVRTLHEKRIRHAVEDGIREHVWRERDIENRARAVGKVNGIRFRQEQEAGRKRRIVQAVNALLPGQAFEIEPPAVGACVELYTIQSLLDVSRSTAWRIAERAGCRPEVHRRGWYATGSHVVVTERLRQALLDWAAHPVRRITHEDVRLADGSIVEPAPRRDGADDIPF